MPPTLSLSLSMLCTEHARATCLYVCVRRRRRGGEQGGGDHRSDVVVLGQGRSVGKRLEEEKPKFAGFVIGLVFRPGQYEQTTAVCLVALSHPPHDVIEALSDVSASLSGDQLRGLVAFKPDTVIQDRTNAFDWYVKLILATAEDSGTISV